MAGIQEPFAVSDAPACNVTVFTPPGKPTRPVGVTRIPPNTPLDQIINMINNNFSTTSTGNYTEVRAKRVTETVRIFDSSGSGAFIDFAVVKAVTLRNPETGQTVVWKR